MDMESFTNTHQQTRLVCGPEKRTLTEPTLRELTPAKTQWPSINELSMVAKTPTQTKSDEIWHMLQRTASSEKKRKNQLNEKIEGWEKKKQQEQEEKEKAEAAEAAARAEAEAAEAAEAKIEESPMQDDDIDEGLPDEVGMLGGFSSFDS